jgi:hypothetical protein
MWRKVPKEQEPHLLKIAIEFTGNHTEYGKAMLEVAKKWRYSCENFLSNKSINRKAWLGHAACSFKHNLPEYIVREAWGKLTDIQRYLANLEAEKTIIHWETNKNKPSNQLQLW